MAPRSPAHLLLPSPLGLLEYDVLEDAVFLGPGPKGGLRASPTPFRGASVALKRGDEGFVARPLPGEANPEINGEVVAERALVDGDRIRLGEHVTLFRTTRGPLMTPEAPPEPAPRVERRAPPRRKNPLGAVLVFSGLVLLLAAAYRAANHMKAIQSAGLVGSDLPELVAYEPGEQGRVARELAALDAQAAQRPDRYADLIPLYRDFRRRHEGTVEAESAGERLRELMTAWSVHERAALDVQVEKSVGAHQFARALEEVRSFEARFGGTEAAHGLEPLRTSIRRAARTALDALIAKVGPLVTPQPREAHRLLIGVSHEFPPDMAVEVIALIESCVQRMVDTRPARGPEPPRRDGDGPPAKGPPAAGNEPPPGEAPLVPLPGPARDTPDREAQCVDAWRAARERLQQGQYAEALEAYTMLLAQYADTASFKEHKAKWMAGRDAARSAGPPGPHQRARRGEEGAPRIRLRVQRTRSLRLRLDDRAAVLQRAADPGRLEARPRHAGEGHGPAASPGVPGRRAS
ncbi:MAG: hypothetical protein O2894_06810 [Planctomycetota bacterium]|nr:hypothetical protein [Planctomycetota bacterium]